MDAHPEIGLICGLSQHWHSWTGNLRDRDRDYIEPPAILINHVYEPPSLAPSRLKFEWSPAPSDLMMRRDALMRVGGFEEDFAGMYGMYEEALLSKLSLATYIFIIGRCWTRYPQTSRVHCETQSRAGNEPIIRKFYREWLEAYLRTIGVNGPEIWRSFRRTRQLLRSGRLIRTVEVLTRIPARIADRVW